MFSILLRQNVRKRLYTFAWQLCSDGLTENPQDILEIPRCLIFHDHNECVDSCFTATLIYSSFYYIWEQPKIFKAISLRLNLVCIYSVEVIFSLGNYLLLKAVEWAYRGLGIDGFSLHNCYVGHMRFEDSCLFIPRTYTHSITKYIPSDIDFNQENSSKMLRPPIRGVNQKQNKKQQTII